MSNGVLGATSSFLFGDAPKVNTRTIDSARNEFITAQDTLVEDVKGTLQTGLSRSQSVLGQAADRVVQGAEAGTTELNRGQSDLTRIATTGGDKIKETISAGVKSAQDKLSTFSETGSNALQQQQNLMGLGNMSQSQISNTLENTPGYQYNLSQGIKATGSIAAARGGSLGGRALKELQRTGAGIASNTFNSTIAQLGQMAQLGQNAATSIAGFDMQGAGMLADAEKSTTQSLMDSVRFGTAGRTSLIENSTAAQTAIYGQDAQMISSIYGGMANTEAQIGANKNQGVLNIEMGKIEAELASEMADWQAGQQMFGDILGAAGTIGAAFI